MGDISPFLGDIDGGVRELGNLAFVSGPTDSPLLERTIGETLDEISQRFPDRIAVKTPRASKTYEQLNGESSIFARGLLHFGIVAGDRVAVSLGNCVEYAIIAYACFKIGAIVVPLNPAYNSDQVLSALNHVSASCFVLSTIISLPYKESTSTAPLLSSILGDDPTPTRVWGKVTSEKVASLKSTVLVNNTTLGVEERDPIFLHAATFTDVIYVNLGHELPPQISKSKGMATIQFTSGTTSTPKAACLSHRSILNNASLVGIGMQLTEQDIICCPPPLYHCFGLVLGLLAALTHGACALLPSEAFDARAVMKSIVEERPTALYGVPTMFLAELELLSQSQFKDHDFSHLRTGVIGGSPIPSSLRQKLHQKFNLTDLASCYGLTESSPIVCMTVPTDSVERKLHTVGRVLPHTSIKIVARDNPSKILQRGEKGELLIAGYCVMDGYWGDELWTSRTLVADSSCNEDGQARKWLKSGDEALIDEEGYIKITGRIKDIIIRGGENIYPPEIEDVLLSHAEIADASVVGLPDERYGEVIAAFLVLKDSIRDGELDRVKTLGEEEVRMWVCGRLNKMLIPKYVFFVDRMPLTASGKIEKYKLKALGVDLLKEASR